MRKYIEQMVINITDICNMECEFCLRGERGKRTLDTSIIPKIFDGIDVIEGLTISGGEPSCYVKGVIAIVDYLVKHKNQIHVNGFYIITNGKKYRQELVDAVKTMLFLYLDRSYGLSKTIQEKAPHIYSDLESEIFYMFNISVSMDMYHEPISFENYMKYRTSGVYSDAKEWDFSNGGVIARGRGVEIHGSRHRKYCEFDVEHPKDDIIESSLVYITVDGKIFGDCDMSYEMEEYNEPAGNLYEESLAEIIQRYAEDNNYK